MSFQKGLLYASAFIMLILIYIAVDIQQDTIKVLQATVEIYETNKVWPTKDLHCYSVPSGGVMCKMNAGSVVLQAHLVTTVNDEILVWVEDPILEGVAWAAINPALQPQYIEVWETFHRTPLFILKTLNEYAGPPPADDDESANPINPRTVGPW